MWAVLVKCSSPNKSVEERWNVCLSAATEETVSGKETLPLGRSAARSGVAALRKGFAPGESPRRWRGFASYHPGLEVVLREGLCGRRRGQSCGHRQSD